MAKYVKTEEGYKKIEIVNSNKMDSYNPVGAGSFSMGRKAGSVIGPDSHAEGSSTVASGGSSHAEGGNTKATSSNDTVSTTSIATNGYYTHAEGYGTVAYGRCSHAEGNGTKSSGNDSHAEGYRTTASGNYSHAEGSDTDASGKCSHAEGGGTKASGIYSHAEGWGTIATGANSHTEGDHTTASGYASHAEGKYTKASGENSHVEGKYNIDDTANKYAHIVGNGSSDTSRSNAHTLDWNGVGWFKDSVKVGGSGQDDSAAKTLATTDYVDTTVSTKISGKQDTLIQSGATVGQIAKITAVDDSGKPIAWQAVDMPSGGAAKEYELIRAITIADGAAESNNLMINTDESGNPFSLKKAKIFGIFPAYNGGTTRPNFSFFMLNNITTGSNAPYCYTSGWETVSDNSLRRCSIEVDLTKPGMQEEMAWRSNSNCREYFGPAKIESITSIGGTNMLIYPGCQFWLYGVRS